MSPDPIVLILLAVIVFAILVALAEPEPAGQLVVSFPSDISQERATAIRDAVRRLGPDDPIILSSGATVSRLGRR